MREARASARTAADRTFLKETPGNRPSRRSGPGAIRWCPPTELTSSEVRFPGRCRDVACHLHIPAPSEVRFGGFGRLEASTVRRGSGGSPSSVPAHFFHYHDGGRGPDQRGRPRSGYDPYPDVQVDQSRAARTPPDPCPAAGGRPVRQQFARVPPETGPLGSASLVRMADLKHRRMAVQNVDRSAGLRHHWTKVPATSIGVPSC